MWQIEHLKWDAFRMRDFGVAYGVLCYLAGGFVTPRLLRAFDARGFTTFTNATNFAGFYVRAAMESPVAWWGAVPLMLCGVNGASSMAIKARAPATVWLRAECRLCVWMVSVSGRSGRHRAPWEFVSIMSERCLRCGDI